MKRIFYPRSLFYLVIDRLDNRSEKSLNLNQNKELAHFSNPDYTLIAGGRIDINDSFSNYIYIEIKTNNIFFKDLKRPTLNDLHSGEIKEFNSDFIDNYIFNGYNWDTPNIAYIIYIDLDENEVLRPNTPDTFYQLNGRLEKLKIREPGNIGHVIQIAENIPHEDHALPGSSLAHVLNSNYTLGPKLKEIVKISVNDNSPAVIADTTQVQINLPNGTGAGYIGEHMLDYAKKFKFRHWTESLFGLFHKTALYDLIGGIIPGVPPPPYMISFFNFLAYAQAVDSITKVSKELLKILREENES
ncbi:MAG: hypothetical protein ACTSWR_08250 [Candidatus Helarchaeota archaeon]